MVIELIGLAGSGKSFLMKQIKINEQDKKLRRFHKFFCYFIYFFKFQPYFILILIEFSSHFLYKFNINAFLSFIKILIIRPFYLYYLANNTIEKVIIIEDGIFQGLLALFIHFPKINTFSLLKIYFRYFPKVSLLVNLDAPFKVINYRLSKRNTRIDLSEYIVYRKIKDHICFVGKDSFGIPIFSYESKLKSSKNIHNLRTYINRILRFNNL